MSVKQIAKKAGVSPATVYRVMAKNPGISETTANRIHQIIREMGITSPRAVYQRSPRRKASTGISTGQVAFVLVGDSPDASLSLIRGIEGALSPESVRLTFAQVAHPDELITLAQERNLDGMILHGWTYPAPSGEAYRRLRQMPLVWSMTHQEDWGDCVQPDNALLGRAAADGLLTAGVKEFAAVIPEPGHLAFESRAQAFCRAGQEAGLPAQVLRYEPDPRPGRPDPLRDVLPQLIGRLKRPGRAPLGLLVPEDTYIGAVYNLLTAHGGQLGKDWKLAVCGTHPDMLAGLDPAPFRVDIDLEKIGRQTAALLLWRLANRDTSTRVVTLVSPKAH